MIMCGCVIIPDPVKAEQHEDGLLRARERMQRLQDERAAEHQQKAEEVGADIGPSMTGIHDMGPDVVVSCVLHVTWVHVVWFYVDMGPNVVENRCLTWVLTSQRLVWNTRSVGGELCATCILYWCKENGFVNCQEFRLGDFRLPGVVASLW